MKNFWIKSTLSAALVAGSVSLAPAPAQANDDVARVLFGLILGAALVDATNNTASAQPHEPTGAAEYNRTRRELDRQQRELEYRMQNTACSTRDELKPDGYVVRYVYNCRGEVIHAYHP